MKSRRVEFVVLFRCRHSLSMGSVPPVYEAYKVSVDFHPSSRSSYFGRRGVGKSPQL